MNEKIKKHFRSQYERFRSEIKLPEYIFWWISRLVMISGCVYAAKNLPGFLVLAVVGNTAATLAIPFFSALFPQSLYFGRLPFRAQTYIDIFVVIGSFLGQCVRIGRFISYYDKWQHLIAGILGVFLGCVLMKTISPETKLDKKQELCGGVGFSFFLMLVWEVFEFFADYYIAGSTNQGYNNSVDYNDIFFRIFGLGAQNEGQAALYDTFFDLISAIVGTLIAIVLFVIGTKIMSASGKKQPELKETADIA